MNRVLLYLAVIAFITLNWHCGAPEAPKTPSATTTTKKATRTADIQAAVLKNNQWNFINTKGELLKDEGYVYADNFSEGWACVNSTGSRMNGRIVGGMYYLIDKYGKKSSFSFKDAFRLHEGRAIVEVENKKAIIDKSGKVIQSGFDKLLHFSDGLAPATIGDVVGYIDRDGKWAFKVDKTVVIDVFSEGLARARKGKKVGFLNTSGKWQVKPTFKFATPFSEKRAAFTVKEESDLFEKYGFIDTKGKVVIPAIYKDAGNFNEGLCNVKKGNKWGYIDQSGKVVIDFQFQDCRGFHEGLAAVKVDNNVGYIDKTGNIVIKPWFNAGFDFQQGRAMIEANKKMGFIDKKGKMVIEPQFERVNPFVKISETNPLFRI